MGDVIFEVIDKTGRKIRLTKKQWKHILKRHPDVINYQEEIKETLKIPLKIMPHPYDAQGRYYFDNLGNGVFRIVKDTNETKGVHNFKARAKSDSIKLELPFKFSFS